MARTEKDFLGEKQIPDDAYYGVQTLRGKENFHITGVPMSTEPYFVKAFGYVKKAAALANRDLGVLDAKVANAITAACDRLIAGEMREQFVTDFIQGGAGTSTNMNANEVIANRAAELLGKTAGRRAVHPNDHVNKGQSSNDVIPTAMHVAALEQIERALLPALRSLHRALAAKAKQFDRIVKIGRTHLQDATPIRLGQEFSGYARQIELAIERIEHCRPSLEEVALGGTAVGTGINMPPKFAGRVIALINKETGLRFREAANHFEAQAAKDAIVETSGALRGLAVSLMKIANDIRWLGSGPRCGFGELQLPETQPGSSIMPGKVNPVIAESVCQVAAQVIGYDATIALCGLSGNFELNVMMPVMAYDLLEAIHLLASSSENFTRRCIEGLSADEVRCRAMIEQSLAMCTALAPVVGYDQAAAIAKEAYRTGKTVREIARTRNLLPGKQLDELLDPWRMTEPGA